MDSFGVMQSEYMFEKPKEAITRIICWVKYGDRNMKECGEHKGFPTSFSKENAGKPLVEWKDLDINIRNNLNQWFGICVDKFKMILNEYPQIMFGEWDFDKWQPMT